MYCLESIDLRVWLSILCELKIKTLYLKTEAFKHKLNDEFEFKQKCYGIDIVFCF